LRVRSAADECRRARALLASEGENPAVFRDADGSREQVEFAIALSSVGTNVVCTLRQFELNGAELAERVLRVYDADDPTSNAIGREEIERFLARADARNPMTGSGTGDRAPVAGSGYRGPVTGSSNRVQRPMTGAGVV
jgi:hypothetical protein